MAIRIPTYDNLQVDTGAAPAGRFEAPGTIAVNSAMAAVPWQQVDAMGKETMNLGNAMADIGIKAQQEANQVRVLDGLNKAKSTIQNLLYDPKGGLVNQSGEAIFNRSSGKPLSQEYSDSLQEQLSTLSSTMGNDAQRKLFDQHAADLAMQFRAQADRHEFVEGRKYKESVFSAGVGTAIRDIGLNADNPAIVESNIKTIRELSIEKARIQGLSPQQGELDANTAVSKAVTGAVMGFLSNNNVPAAEAYLSKYHGQMDSNDVIRINDVIRTQGKQMTAKFASEETMKMNKEAFDPSDQGRLDALVIGVESSGRHFNKDGTLLQGPTTKSGDRAQGITQVMPATGTTPGYGVAPLKDQSEAEYRRFGSDYLKAMINEYKGDVPKALAAYNFGPGNLDKAIKAAEKEGVSWITKVPTETQKYVDTITTQFAAGGGRTKPPSLAQVQEQAMTLAGSDPEARLMAKAEVTNKYLYAQENQRQKQAQGLSDAYQYLDQNKGSYESLPLPIRQNIDPKDIPAVKAFSENLIKGDDKTDFAVYGDLVGDPQSLKNMTPAQVYAMRPKLSKADFAYVQNLYSKVNSGVAADKLADVNSSALKPILDNRLSGVINGWAQSYNKSSNDKSTGDSARVGSIKQYVNSNLVRQQYELGRQLTPEEMRKSVDQMFSQDVTFRKMYMWGAGSNYNEKMLGMEVSDIPPDVADRIKSDFITKGIEKPTDLDILSTYWRLKSAQKMSSSSKPDLLYSAPKLASK